MDTAKAPDSDVADLIEESDMVLCTNGLTRGKHLAKAPKTLPSFDDLLRGLNHLPCGLDARGLTQCLIWYRRMRNSFTPPLHMSVLHTQALLRALRVPLKPTDLKDLDLETLKEWRDKGRFEELKLWDEEQSCAQILTWKHLMRAQIHLNFDNGSVESSFSFRLRNVLAFPFVAMHNFFREALIMGIDRAEKRQQERTRKQSRPCFFSR